MRLDVGENELARIHAVELESWHCDLAQNLEVFKAETNSATHFKKIIAQHYPSRSPMLIAVYYPSLACSVKIFPVSAFSSIPGFSFTLVRLGRHLEGRNHIQCNQHGCHLYFVART